VSSFTLVRFSRTEVTPDEEILIDDSSFFEWFARPALEGCASSDLFELNEFGYIVTREEPPYLPQLSKLSEFDSSCPPPIGFGLYGPWMRRPRNPVSRQHDE
jgi:hypothetical protein